MSVEFVLNGNKVSTQADPAARLIDVLREEFGLLGVKEGCGEGECGACSILLDGDLAPACIIALGVVRGREVLTIEGYTQTERFALLADSFAQAGAVQCGYCTPGMLLAGESLLRKNPDPAEPDIRQALAGNLCRCTGYNQIVQAMGRAAQRLKARGDAK
jgi:carbon-monoxide dehydrogenase small subunit